jgi:hypothetical protein
MTILTSTMRRAASYHEKSPKCATEMFGGLSDFGDGEVYAPRRNVKRTKSSEMKRALERLEYTDADVELIAYDSRQFEALKQSLRNKGAVTNEVLKQKLPLFIKFKKDRLAQTHPEVVAALRQLPSRTRNLSGVDKVERMSMRRPVNRILTDEEKYEAGTPDASTVSAMSRILRPGAKGRSVPLRTSTFGPQTSSEPRNSPTRAKSNNL